MTTSTSKRSRTSIDASRGTIFKLDPNDVRIIGFDTAHKEGEHILWQERALEDTDDALVQSMIQNGFTTVIDVRKDGDNLDVVVGRRRVKAARRACELMSENGQEPLKILVQVKRGTDLEMFESVISENALRKDPSALQMASDLNRFLKMGASLEQAARAVGKSVQHVNLMLKLLDLDESIKAAVRNGELSGVAAMRLADLSREDQKAEFAKLKEGGKVTEKAVRAAVKAKREGKDEATEAPTRRVLNRLIAHERAAEVLGEDGVRALRFALGDLNPRCVSGLTELLRELSKPAK